jgi:hypothetical protein
MITGGFPLKGTALKRKPNILQSLLTVCREALPL